MAVVPVGEEELWRGCSRSGNDPSVSLLCGWKRDSPLPSPGGAVANTPSPQALQTQRLCPSTAAEPGSGRGSAFLPRARPSKRSVSGAAPSPEQRSLEGVLTPHRCRFSASC